MDPGLGFPGLGLPGLGFAGGGPARPPGGEPETVLRVTDVAVSYGAVPALRGVSLSVRRGEILGLLGPNGAGKSTLLAVISGLEPVRRGAVRLGAGARIGFMPQDHGVYPTLTGRENLRYVGRTWGLRRAGLTAAVDAVLADVGLTEHADRAIGGYSGGMRRRLSFAAALLGDPAVVLLDEPTVGVDPQSRLAITELAVREARNGRGVVYSTHHMEELQGTADRVVILHEGQVLVEDTVAGIVSRHGRSYVEAGLRGPGQEWAVTALRAGSGIRDVVDVHTEGDRLALRVLVDDPAAAIRTVLDTARAAGCEVADIRLRESTLESAFIALTGRELRDQ